MQLRKIAALIAIPVVATAALSACGGGGKGSAGSNGMISIGVGEPKSLIPTHTNESTGAQVLEALFTGLIKIDPKTHKPVPAAAESITTTDNKVWEIALKPGWTFHNGEKVTANSYKKAWEYGAYTPNGQNNSTFFEKIEGYDEIHPADPKAVPTTTTLKGIEVIDDLHFKVTLKEPFPAFETMVGYTAFFPMPEAAYADMKAFEEAPIGNGPFQMEGKWNRDKSIKVKAYPSYAGTKPKVSGIEFRIYQQLTAAYADLVAGNLDVLPSIPTESRSNAKNDLGDRFKLSPNSSFTFLGFPMYDPQFANPDVRKALSMAINRQEIVAKVFNNTNTPADSFVSPIVPGYQPGAGGEGVKFDVEKAKELLAKAGGLPGGTLNISYNVDGGHKEWIEAVCNQLSKNLGIKCTTSPEPKFADLLIKAGKKEKIGLIRLGWVRDYPAKDNYLRPLYSSNGSSNYYGYNNPEFDAKLDAGDKAADEEERQKYYAEAEAILAKDMPVIPMFFGQNVYGHSARVQNVFVEESTHVDLLQLETK